MQLLWSLLDTVLPARLRSLLSPIIGSPEKLKQFITYGSVSLTALLLDVGTYRVAIVFLPVPLALATGNVLSVASHFSLNKYVTFRRHDRPITTQFTTYLMVTAIQYVMVLAVIELLMHFANMSSWTAKLASIPITIPFSFLANKFLVFGAGVRATLQRLRKGT